MDTNTVAFNFSPYLLPIVVHEILSNLDFAYSLSFNSHNLEKVVGHHR